MRNEVSSFLREFEEIIKENYKFLYLPRGIELQKDSLSQLEAFLKKIVKLKETMIIASDEESANTMLGLEEYLAAYICELRMLICLKEDKMEEAWEDLISAQMYLRFSLQASNIALQFGGNNYAQKLYLIEKLFFPPQTFMSSGLIATNSQCSICGKEYGECDHLVGKPYMGKLCYRIMRGIKEIKEVSIVGDPGDKHCRVTSISDDEGHMRNYMTWRIQEGKQ
jgi:hypothetical protein